MNTKKKIMLATLVLIICGGGISTNSIIQHNEKVHAQEMAQQKHEDQIKKEKADFKTAKAAVDTAYESRDSKDIELATRAIEQLSDNQKEEKETLTTKINKLNSFIKQADELKTALNKAEQSKKETDIASVQKLLDNATDDYLKKDKEAISKSLDKLKATIKEERVKAEEKAAADAEAARQAEATQQAAQQAEQNNQSSGQPAYNEQGQQAAPAQPNYQQPAQPAPSQPAPAPAPSQPEQPAPEQPVGPNGGNGTPNGAGITDSPGGWDTPGNAGIEWGK
ncbi:hypothetical protein [Enterococcus sp. DIV0187]|uniref:hypothetical protein n=1 Tax=Enterococcus sp. DIV0187 TaxID=2774644 RepID=UPI003F1F5FF9